MQKAHRQKDPQSNQAVAPVYPQGQKIYQRASGHRVRTDTKAGPTAYRT